MMDGRPPAPPIPSQRFGAAVGGCFPLFTEVIAIKNMIYLCPLIHANLQYAEFPPQTVPQIVERSYLPTLSYFAAHPELPAVFEYSGISLEWMAERWPETIDLLGLLLEREQIELLGSTYANPILPLIPSDHARLHLAEFWLVYEQLFGRLQAARPTGIFLQEFAYDPGLAPSLVDAGYQYTILTPRLLLAGLHRRMNLGMQKTPPPPPSLAENGRELLHPVEMIGAQGARLAAFPLYRELIGLMFDTVYGRKPFSELAARLEAVSEQSGSRPALLLFGPSDAEFIGAYELLGKEFLSPEALGDLLARIGELPFVSLGLPGRYLAQYPPQTSIYVPAGSSEQVIDLWTADPDNQRLNALCAEAAGKLRLASVLGADQPLLLEQGWRAMLLAENSDGRGWMPCPERRLDCYDQALRAIAIAEEIIQNFGRKREITSPHSEARNEALVRGRENKISYEIEESGHFIPS
jgi:hypothetical protein